MTTYKLVSEKTGKEVNRAYFNGFEAVGQFLEDFYFKITLNYNKTDFIVIATDDTKKHIKRHYSDVKKWEKEIKNYIQIKDNVDLYNIENGYVRIVLERKSNK